MAPIYLPRVGAFPIFPENHPITLAGSSSELPLTVKKNFPLKDRPAPNFILTDQTGKKCSLHDTMRLGRPIVLFFFPLAGSPHCTKESCLFRDAIEVTPIFSVLQAIVIGISQDPPERAKRFTDEHKLSYPILYDYKRKVMEMYGVGRTTFGLVDNRATFIIDPSGIVRGLAEGVLNANGHLKFAEKWLIRLEDELSERSKQYYEYAAKEGEMIAGFDPGTGKLVQVVYGDEGSAAHGGLDGVPRYGAASIAPAKQLASPVSRGRALADHARDGSSTAGSVENGGHEKNMWTNWKHLLAQLSSPDDMPPPIVLTRSRKNSEALNRSEGEREPRSDRSNATRTLPRRRAKSPFGRKRHATQDDAAPPVPLVTPPRSNGYSNGHGRQGWVDPLDGEAEESKPAAWDGDRSVRNSISSTPPSSQFSHARFGSQSSSHTANHSPLATALTKSASSSGHTKVVLPPAKPAVTSEVLMVDGPIITRRASRSFSSPPSSPLASQPMSQRSNSMAPLTLPVHATQIESQQPDHHQQDLEPRRSSGPSDVPEDADPEDDDVSSQPSPYKTSPYSKPLPLTPSPKTATRQLSTSTSSPLSWAKGFGRRTGSSDGTSSPLPTTPKGRLGRRPQPPVVTSQYSPTSWDSAYTRIHDRPSDADIASRPKHLSLDAHSNGLHRSPSSLYHSHSQSHLDDDLDRSKPSLSHPFSNGRRSRTPSLLAAKGVDGLSESPKSPPIPSPARNLVLQSLSTDNGSQHSFKHFDTSRSTTPVVVSASSQGHSMDDHRSRMIPRKAPPPMYAPPSPPPHAASADQEPSTPTANTPSSMIHILSMSPKETELGAPLQVAVSRSSSGEGLHHSPSSAFVHSFQSESRRASAADSLRSTGTFG